MMTAVMCGGFSGLSVHWCFLRHSLHLPLTVVAVSAERLHRHCLLDAWLDISLHSVLTQSSILISRAVISH